MVVVVVVSLVVVAMVIELLIVVVAIVFVLVVVAASVGVVNAVVDGLVVGIRALTITHEKCCSSNLYIHRKQNVPFTRLTGFTHSVSAVMIYKVTSSARQNPRALSK